MAGAYRIIDRRGVGSIGNAAPIIQTNGLYPAASPTDDRRRVPDLDYDGFNLVTPQGRRNLMTAARRLMASNSVVRSAINDMVRLSASNYQMHFYTDDPDWNNQAEELLKSHDLICDSRGPGYGMRTITEFLVKGALVDGDLGVIKYFGATSVNGVGYPMFQIMPAHRITSDVAVGVGTMKGGRYNGLRYIDGVVVNDYLRPVAYLISAGSDRRFNAEVIAVPARDMSLAYFPEYPDQVRGYSQLGASIFDWQDVQDTRRFDLIGRKARASKAIIVHNESGEADETQRMLTTSDRAFTDNELTSVTREVIEGGTIEYYKSSANVRLESVKDDRPSTNGMEFDRTIARDALAGIGWSYDYAIDPTKAGGAQMRVVIDKINRTIHHLRTSLIEPMRRQLDNWRVSVFMARGDLEFNENWGKFRYQTPAKLTADAKYQSAVDITEYAAGFTTHERIAANRSSSWEDDQDQKAKEIRRLMEISERDGIPIAYLISGISNPGLLTQALIADNNADQSPQNSD